MRTLRSWLWRLAGFVHARRRRDELADELDSHFQLHIDDNIRAGMTPEEARRAALIQFGSIEAIKEQYRERATVPLLEAVVQDLRYGARKLRRQPAFSLLAVVTLALGVGATAAMFSFVDALMFRTPPHVREPHRVVRMPEIANYPRYLDISQRLRALDLAAVIRTTVSLGVGAEATSLVVECVTPSYLPVLGAKPGIGRAFLPDEDTHAAEPSTVIAHNLWQRQFGGDAGVLGRRAVIAGRAHTIIGVAPPGFRGAGLEPVDAWILLASYPEACSLSREGLQAKGGFWLTTIGRIREGFTFEQAAADAISADINPDTATMRRPDGTVGPVAVTKPPQLRPLRESRAADQRLALWLVWGAAVLLSIASANVAGLLSMRAIGRRREVAVRLQLGASRGRVFGQLLTENLLIAAACGVAAVALGAWIRALLRAFYPLADIGGILDGRTGALVAGFALLGGLISGVIPAIEASRADAAQHLRTGRSLHERSRWWTLLLTAQVALALTLVVAAGLFVRSVANYRRGFAYDLDRVIAASVDFRKAGVADAAEIRQRYQRMLDRVRQLPDVEAVALGSIVVAGDERGGMVTGIGRAAYDEDACCHSSVAVTADYFATLGIRILKGRTFSEADARPGAAPVVILDELLAKKIFSEQDPTGKCVVVGYESTGCVEVIGVSESARSGLLRMSQLDSEFFLPLSDRADAEAPRVLLVRMRRASERSVGAIAAAVRTAAPDLPYINIRPVDDLVNSEARSWRLAATIFGLFGVLSLVLAATGLYGALAFSICQRTPEIGVRVAFGAAPKDIVTMVVRHALTIAFVGWFVGGLAAISLGRYARSMLFGVPPGDLATFALASCIILAAALVGSLVPALRAARIDPAVALRTE